MSDNLPAFDLDKYNKEVRDWAFRVGSGLKGNIMAFNGKGTGQLAQMLQTRTRKSFNEVDLISYHFPRHGVFVQKGVGRGYVMQGGTVVRGIRHDKVVKPLQGPVNRRPEDWFNGTMEREVPVLADIIANHMADKASVAAMGANAMGMQIQ
jgi:hypothetical protein